MTHTKGPWYLDKFGNLKSDSSNSTMMMVPFYGVCLSGSEEAKANTALIAAAPELLEALEEIVEQLEGGYFNFSNARAAIAKAEGL